MADAMEGRQLSEALLTVTQVAKLLHVHPNSVRRWANLGLLRAYRIGPRGDRRFHPGDVRRFLESWAGPHSEPPVLAPNDGNHWGAHGRS